MAVGYGKDINKVVKKLRDQNFLVVPAKAARCQVFSPDGAQMVWIPGPNARVSARGMDNMRAGLRRIGAEI